MTEDPRSRPATLATALRSAAADLQAQPLPEALRRRVLAASRPASMPVEAAAATQRRRTAWPAWAGGAAALAGVLVLLLHRPAPRGPDDQPRIGVFLPVVPAERWPRQAVRAWVVSTELPRDRLAALGLPYDPARAGERVPADLLLHPSGEVLAVRLPGRGQP